MAPPKKKRSADSSDSTDGAATTRRRMGKRVQPLVRPVSHRTDMQPVAEPPLPLQSGSQPKVMQAPHSTVASTAPLLPTEVVQSPRNTVKGAGSKGARRGVKALFKLLRECIDDRLTKLKLSHDSFRQLREAIYSTVSKYEHGSIGNKVVLCERIEYTLKAIFLYAVEVLQEKGLTQYESLGSSIPVFTGIWMSDYLIESGLALLWKKTYKLRGLYAIFNRFMEIPACDSLHNMVNNATENLRVFCGKDGPSEIQEAFKGPVSNITTLTPKGRKQIIGHFAFHKTSYLCQMASNGKEYYDRRRDDNSKCSLKRASIEKSSPRKKRNKASPQCAAAFAELTNYTMPVVDAAPSRAEELRYHPPVAANTSDTFESYSLSSDESLLDNTVVWTDVASDSCGQMLDALTSGSGLAYNDYLTSQGNDLWMLINVLSGEDLKAPEMEVFAQQTTSGILFNDDRLTSYDGSDAMDFLTTPTSHDEELSYHQQVAADMGTRPNPKLEQATSYLPQYHMDPYLTQCASFPLW